MLPISRRQLLHSSTCGIGSVALAWLLNDERARAEVIKPTLEKPRFDTLPKVPHHPPRARAMISLFMQGGPSHHDTLDYKPKMAEYASKPFPGKLKQDAVDRATTKVFPSPWKFSRHGRAGTWISELLPHLGTVADDITVINSMTTGVNNHGQSIYSLNSGRLVAGHPSLGSWVCYGLGSEARNLPAFMSLTDVTLPVAGVDHWGNGWLPSLYQGTVIRQREPRILNLDPPAHLKGTAQGNYLRYLDEMNREHLARHAGENDLDARIAGYELAAQMQTAAKDVLDLTGESAATKRLYGLDDPITAEYGTRCLIARRLVERGVRFVQVLTANQNWDNHQSIKTLLPNMCRKTDKPAAALVRDLRERGLLDSTLVAWGGEMGRLPVVEGNDPEKVGRDHNTYGFSWWLAGGGIKRGHVHGATDDFGHHAVTDVVNQHDMHATLLHLFGLDHRKLTHLRNGLEQSLTDSKPCRVVDELLA